MVTECGNMSAMASIGLRELTHHTAVIARRVRDGETIIVTDHGRPVLRMIPAGASDASTSDGIAGGAPALSMPWHRSQ